jgi:hypothetical protein
VNSEEKPRANSGSSAAPERDDLTEIKHLLRQSIPPLQPNQLAPHTDLWPQLRARIESQRNTDRAAANINRASPRIRVAWFDWALAALAAAALIFFPGIIPALLYHF